jgi:hypothetical protein
MQPLPPRATEQERQENRAEYRRYKDAKHSIIGNPRRGIKGSRAFGRPKFLRPPDHLKSDWSKNFKHLASR